MIRNLKVLIAAAMAVAAFGAIGAAGAQAAEFHCNVTPCVLTPKADGTAKNSHHVTLIKQGAVQAGTTCNSITGNVTFEGKTTKEITFKEISYDGCTIAGAPSTVNMNGCDYLFTSTGELHLKCPEGKKIEHVITETGCTISTGEQTLNGVSFKTVSSPTEITMSFNVLNIAATANGNCAGIGIAAGAVTDEYTTGNTLLTGETEAGVMAEAWFE
jgi:hypothetical protein